MSDDEDDFEWTEEAFVRARRADQVHDAVTAAALVRKPGRPSKAVGQRKERISIRLEPEILRHYRATGPGWQSRMEADLKSAIQRR